MADLTDLDYSALKRKPLKLNAMVIIGACISLLICIVLDILFGLAIFATIVVLCGGIGIFYVIAYFMTSRYDTLTELDRFKAFATQNNLTYRTGVAKPKYLPPEFWMDSIDMLDYAVTTNHDGMPLRFFNHKYYDPKTDVYISYRVLNFEVDGALPGFVVNAKANVTKIPDKLLLVQFVKLEGNFSDSFDVFFPKGGQVDVLSVLTPDVMQAIEPYWADIDIVTSGKYVWLFTRGKRLEATQALVDAFLDVAPELNHRAKTFRSE